MKKYFLILLLVGEIQGIDLFSLKEKEKEYTEERLLATQILECQKEWGSLSNEDVTLNRRASFRRSSVVIHETETLRKKIKVILKESTKPSFIKLLEQYYEEGEYDIPTRVLSFIHMYFPEADLNIHITKLLEKYGSRSAFHQQLLRIQSKFIQYCEEVNAKADEVKNHECTTILKEFYKYYKKLETLEAKYPALMEMQKKSIHVTLLKIAIQSKIEQFLEFINQKFNSSHVPPFFEALISKLEKGGDDQQTPEQIILAIQDQLSDLLIHNPDLRRTTQGKNILNILLNYQKIQKKQEAGIKG